MTEAVQVVPKPLFRRHTPRPRLTALLDEAVAQAILVTAPAGYGKTTLAREWLQGRTAVAWYRASSTSADVGAFSAGLSDAVAPIVPGAGERVRQRLRVGDATERLAHPLAEMLAEDLEEWPAGGMIVLDDYHLMAESAPVESFLDRLLTLAPIRVLVTSRRRPGWATARRFLYGEAVEIDRGQLAMTEEEALRVLEGRSTKAVAALVRQAKGWPALIGLASLSADLSFPREKVSQSLFRYFAEEVLRGEPAEVQRFMLLASVPSAVGVAVAREALGFDDPEPLIARLRDHDLLHDEDGNRLRFHPLLREFLRKRLRADDPDAFADRSRRVVEHASAREDWEEAFALAVESGWTRRAAELAGRAARSLLAGGQSETLERWLDACGADAVVVPGAALARAELLLRQGEMTASETIARDTLRRLAEDHPDFARGCVILGQAQHFSGNDRQAIKEFEIAERVARTDHDRKEALWGLVLTATELAPSHLPRILAELEAYSEDFDVRLRIAIGRYSVAELGGSIAGTWSEFASLLPVARYARDPSIAGSFMASAATAAILRGRYQMARTLIQDSLQICTELRLMVGISICTLSCAAIEIGLRQFPKARRSLRTLAAMPIAREDPYMRAEMETAEVRLLASQGLLAEALHHCDRMPSRDAPMRCVGAQMATVAMLEAAAGSPDSALSGAEAAERCGHTVEIACCVRLARAIVARHATMAEFIERSVDAVRICAEADYFDGLVLALRVCPELITAVQASDDCLEVLQTTLGESRDFALARRANIPLDATSDHVDALTPREREVLGLLCQGMSNGEIARQLYIARSTAKVHVRHILSKLGVRTRLQAAIRGRELLESERA